MYQTIAAPAEDEFVQQKSRFLGAIVPVQTEEEALAFIEAKRKHYWDATHNVYAYIIRAKDGLPEIKRCSDDGEPQGTAGRPALEVLEREGLTDVALVCTRYFGGILLGAGGLVRAYAHTAKNCGGRRPPAAYGPLPGLYPGFGLRQLRFSELSAAPI